MKNIIAIICYLFASRASAEMLNINACWPAGTTLTCLLPVAVPSGGTGVATLTTNSLVLAQGASAFTVVTADTTTTHVLHGGTPPSFTAVTASDLPAITQSAAGVDTNAAQRLGTNTNDNASAGNIGEVMSINRIQSNGLTLSTNSTANVGTTTSITLTAGDWQVSGAVGIAVNSTTTLNQILAAVSKTTATIPSTDTAAVPTSGEYLTAIEFGTALQVTDSKSPVATIPPFRVSVANGATLQIFLVVRVDFGGTSTVCQAFGSMQAIRAR